MNEEVDKLKEEEYYGTAHQPEQQPQALNIVTSEDKLNRQNACLEMNGHSM
jgi:hypothetical protein